MNVVILKILVKWFKGKKMALAFSLLAIIGRVGTAAVLILSPHLIEAKTGWTTSLWLAALAMLAGFLLLVVYLLYDRRREEPSAQPSEEFKTADLLNLFKNKSFIYLCLLCVMFYSAFFPFLSFFPDLLHNKFHLSLKWSGALSSLMIWGTILFMPVFGWLVDKKGRTASLLLFGSGLLFVSHSILSLTDIPPFVAILFLGIAFSVVPATLWPAVPRIVDEKRTGTAYGIMTWVQSLGILIFPYLAGKITDLSNKGVTADMVRLGRASLNYRNTTLIFVGLGVLASLFALLLKKEDAGKGEHSLELPDRPSDR
jgi:nitrate/nitrite transporter NarK